MVFSKKDGSQLIININGTVHLFPNSDTGYVEMTKAWIEWRLKQ